jgi:hypothetical protein
MVHFRDHDYGFYYDESIERIMNDFLHYSSLPEWFYFDATVESSFCDLRAAIAEYKRIALNRVWCNGDGTAGVPREWEDSQLGRFEESVKTMNKAATKVWQAYSEFIQCAKVRLF